jgi:hypothetical protein
MTDMLEKYVSLKNKYNTLLKKYNIKKNILLESEKKNTKK